MSNTISINSSLPLYIGEPKIVLIENEEQYNNFIGEKLENPSYDKYWFLCRRMYSGKRIKIVYCSNPLLKDAVFFECNDEKNILFGDIWSFEDELTGYSLKDKIKTICKKKNKELCFHGYMKNYSFVLEYIYDLKEKEWLDWFEMNSICASMNISSPELVGEGVLLKQLSNYNLLINYCKAFKKEEEGLQFINFNSSIIFEVR